MIVERLCLLNGCRRLPCVYFTFNFCFYEWVVQFGTDLFSCSSQSMTSLLFNLFKVDLFFWAQMSWGELFPGTFHHESWHKFIWRLPRTTFIWGKFPRLITTKKTKNTRGPKKNKTCKTARRKCILPISSQLYIAMKTDPGVSYLVRIHIFEQIQKF
jgi:hypothetical protein